MSSPVPSLIKPLSTQDAASVLDALLQLQRFGDRLAPLTDAINHVPSLLCNQLRVIGEFNLLPAQLDFQQIVQQALESTPASRTTTEGVKAAAQQMQALFVDYVQHRLPGELAASLDMMASTSVIVGSTKPRSPYASIEELLRELTAQAGDRPLVDRLTERVTALVDLPNCCLELVERFHDGALKPIFASLIETHPTIATPGEALEQRFANAIRHLTQQVVVPLVRTAVQPESTIRRALTEHINAISVVVDSLQGTKTQLIHGLLPTVTTEVRNEVKNDIKAEIEVRYRGLLLKATGISAIAALLIVVLLAALGWMFFKGDLGLGNIDTRVRSLDATLKRIEHQAQEVSTVAAQTRQQADEHQRVLENMLNQTNAIQSQINVLRQDIEALNRRLPSTSR